MKNPKLLFVQILFILFFSIHSIDNGLGITPPMGWSSWNHYKCNINQKVIKKNANKLVSLGLAKKGYIYINLDDCWQVGRQFWSKQLQADMSKFPSGMDGLSQYIHKKGLKFGLYSDAGTNTCEGRPGSYGFEKIDAQTFAKWEVDYFKYDNCYNLNVPAKDRYEAMHKALNETKRTIFYSICNWGEQNIWQWGVNVGNSWRTTGDINPNWKNIIEILDKQAGLQKYAAKGGWNDPDMLQVGNSNLTLTQSLSHFALWCLLKAPLIIGCDLTNVSKQILHILGNEELISINQDQLGIQGRRIKSQNGVNGLKQIWGGPLSKNRYVLIFLNRGDDLIQINVSLKNQVNIEYEYYSQRDPVRHKNIGETNYDILSQAVQSHGVEVRILELKKKQNNLFQQ